MKEKKEIKKLTLNYLLAQIKNKKIELQRELNDDEIIALIKKEVKAVNETLSFLEKTDKAEELSQEREKKAILESYLPATLSREDTQALIVKLIEELNITELKTQRGLLMKKLMADYKSEIDGSTVNEIINGML